MAEIQVTTWSELVSAVNSGETDISFPEGGGTLDLNDEYPEGVPSITLKNHKINGNGWIIRNMYINGVTAFVSTGYNIGRIANFEFENIYAASNGRFVQQSSGSFLADDGIFFDNCKFAGALHDSSFIYVSSSWSFSGNRYFNRCSMNFDLLNQSSFCNNEACGLTNCSVNLNGSATGNLRLLMLNSELKGSLTSANENKISIDGSSVTSKIDISLEGFSAVEYTGNSSIVINTDKTGNAAVSDNFIKCDSEQMKNAEYLKSKGFPIGVD